MPSLLVTGGAGFMGSAFVRYWRRRHPGDLVVVLDALTYAGDVQNLEAVRGDPGFEFVHGDILDRALVEELLAGRGIDTVVHFAAETHVDRSIAGPDAFVRTNVLGTERLLEAARAVWLDTGTGRPHRFHHVSTDEVYGTLGWDDPPCPESAPMAPSSPYAASKAASDHLVLAWHRTWGLQTTLTRASNNYGPRQYPEKLIPLFLRNALSGRSLPVYGDGRNVRDWLHVDDHCRATEAALERGRPGECYNVGSGEALTNLEVVDRLCGAVDELFARRPDLRERHPHAPAAQGRPTAELVTFVPDRPGHDLRYAMDTGKAREAMGFEPLIPFQRGLPECVAWYAEQGG